LLLGRAIGGRERVSCTRFVLREAKWSSPQIHLSPRERQENPKGSFAVVDPERVRGKRDLLIDDAMTMEYS